MSQSDDLTKLFDRFGGHPDTYREIVREDAAHEARERWPLLASMRADRSMPTPPVQPASLTSGIASDVGAEIGTPNAAPPQQAVVPAAPAARPAASEPAPVGSPWQPAVTAPVAPVTPAAAGNLQNVFARLEGRGEAPAPAERTPHRRSFLDRLNRS